MFHKMQQHPLKVPVIFLLVIVLSINNVFGASLGNPILLNNENAPDTSESSTKVTAAVVAESLELNNTITILEDAVKNYMEIQAAYNEPAPNEQLRVKRANEAFQAIQNRSRNALATLGIRINQARESTSGIRTFLRNFFTRIVTYLKNVWARLSKSLQNAAVGARRFAENTVDFQSGLASTGVLQGLTQYPFNGPNNGFNLSRLNSRLDTVVQRFKESQAGVISSLTGQTIDVGHNTKIHQANPHEPRFSINIHTIAPHVEEDHTVPSNSIGNGRIMNNFYEVPNNSVANKPKADDRQENEIKSLTLVEETDKDQPVVESFTSVAPGIFYAPGPAHPKSGDSDDQEELPKEVFLNDAYIEQDMDGYFSPLESMAGTELAEAVETLEASPPVVQLVVPEKETKKFYKVAPYIGGAFAFILIIWGLMNFLKRDKLFSRSK